MSWYNSENSYVLTTHNEPNCEHVNTRVFLMHVFKNGMQQYVIGSYFEESEYDPVYPDAPIVYEWQWGHYFDGEGAFDRAMDYWQREVLGIEEQTEV